MAANQQRRSARDRSFEIGGTSANSLAPPARPKNRVLASGKRKAGLWWAVIIGEAEGYVADRTAAESPVPVAGQKASIRYSWRILLMAVTCWCCAPIASRRFLCGCGNERFLRLV